MQFTKYPEKDYSVGVHVTSWLALEGRKTIEVTLRNEGRKIWPRDLVIVFLNPEHGRIQLQNDLVGVESEIVFNFDAGKVRGHQTDFEICLCDEGLQSIGGVLSFQRKV